MRFEGSRKNRFSGQKVVAYVRQMNSCIDRIKIHRALESSQNVPRVRHKNTESPEVSQILQRKNITCYHDCFSIQSRHDNLPTLILNHRSYKHFSKTPTIISQRHSLPCTLLNQLKYFTQITVFNKVSCFAFEFLQNCGNCRASFCKQKCYVGHRAPNLQRFFQLK